MQPGRGEGVILGHDGFQMRGVKASRGWWSSLPFLVKAGKDWRSWRKTVVVITRRPGGAGQQGGSRRGKTKRRGNPG